MVTDLRRDGAEVKVAMTEAADAFRHPDPAARAQRASGRLQHLGATSPAEAGHGMTHLDLASWCEVQVVVAASADLIARLALGLAGDAVTATALACRAPLLVAPAMESAMWEHPATQGHVATLVARGGRIIGPVYGRLASGHESTGRMAEPDVIVSAVRELLVGGA